MSVALKKNKFGIRTVISDETELLNIFHRTRLVLNNEASLRGLICRRFTIKALLALRGADPSYAIQIFPLTDILLPIFILHTVRNFRMSGLLSISRLWYRK